jgi:CHAP domain/Putative peptidoglycan binding domain
MTLLKKNSTGSEVQKLIKRLASLGYLPAGKTGSVFDHLTLAAVKAFQSSHIGPNGLPLKVDGIAGPLTQFAISVALGELPEPPNMSLPTPLINQMPSGASRVGWNALQIAKAEMAAGAKEIGGDDKGPYCKKYLAVTGLGEGYDWCAAFVSYCFKEGNPGAMPYKATAGARATLTAFKDKGWEYKATFENSPLPGDIIVWWRGTPNGWKGHVGIVSGYANGIVHTIEGNKTSKVDHFSYVFGQIDKLLGFARAKPTG